jgi:hypothetical protein
MLWSGEWAWRSRGRVGLERGGESPEGAPAPRVRRRIARGGARPSSEAENRPRGIAAGQWWAVVVSLGPGPSYFGLRPRGACFFRIVACLFVFYYFRKGGLLRLLGDPHGCPRQ